MSIETDSRFEKQLDAMIERIQACQHQKGVETCSACQSFIGCELRREYVTSVYNSMSKGDIGGFEF